MSFVLFFGAALSQALQDRPAPSAAAATVLAGLRRQAAPCMARWRSIPARATVAAALGERAGVDQCLRATLGDPAFAALSVADRQAVFTAVFCQITPVDEANTAYLRSVLPADGWFRASRDGEATAHDAWLILQHSPDRAFQDAVLARMAPLARVGEVKGEDYALLYDRSAMFDGRPQYYGSQYRCQDRRLTLYTLRDLAGVEARRRAMGMAPLAENRAKVTANGGC